jgi:hypothetical protein
LKLATSEVPRRVHPSANTKMINLSGSENIMGDTMTIPNDVRTLATARSIAINGK